VNQPLISEIGVVGLVYHKWGTYWMTPHHVLTRLANYFHVLWVEPAHDRSGIWNRLWERTPKELAGIHRIPPGFTVYNPEPWLPEIYTPEWLGKFTRETRIRRGFEKLRRRGCRKLLLHLWHPRFASALDVAGYDFSMYHLDDDYSFLPEPPPPDERETKVIRRVDQVFAISPGLAERKGKLNPNLSMIPEGVDYRLYSSQIPEPADISNIPRPRVGYTGTLKSQLDWPLLRELSKKHSDWSFVFVGRRSTGLKEDGKLLEELSSRNNVYFLGEKSMVALASYPQHFDVCIMPYRVNGYTHNIYPLKLHEYLACGRPVVASRIRSLLDFGHVVRLPGNGGDWSHQLAAALAPTESSANAIGCRRQVAREHDWSEIIYRIASIISARIGPNLAQRVRKLDLNTEP
jgi:glycosyltransferase involved in cell wall biosynthesis